MVAILRDGTEYGELSGEGEAEIVLDRTPFYAEGGGQVGDQGTLHAGDGAAVFSVQDTRKPVGQLIVHRGRLHGTVRVGGALRAVVDARRRASIMRNHTATHLLHRALRNVRQPIGAARPGRWWRPTTCASTSRSSVRSPTRRRWPIEEQVRTVIRDDRPVSVAYLPMADAIAAGADAFFDEKYGEIVRTVAVQDYSRELCGGTHCRATGQIGGFLITGERSIGSGMRRIEAVTGEAADALVAERFALLEQVVAALGAPDAAQVPARLAEQQARLKELERRLRAGGSAGRARAGGGRPASRRSSPASPSPATPRRSRGRRR